MSYGSRIRKFQCIRPQLSHLELLSTTNSVSNNFTFDILLSKVESLDGFKRCESEQFLLNDSLVNKQF